MWRPFIFAFLARTQLGFHWEAGCRTYNEGMGIFLFPTLNLFQQAQQGEKGSCLQPAEPWACPHHPQALHLPRSAVGVSPSAWRCFPKPAEAFGGRSLVTISRTGHYHAVRALAAGWGDANRRGLGSPPKERGVPQQFPGQRTRSFSYQIHIPIFPLFFSYLQGSIKLQKFIWH